MVLIGNGVGVVGQGRIGMPMLYYLLRLDVPVLVVTEIPNLGGRETIDTLVASMNSDDMSRGRLPWEVSKLGKDILGVKLNGSTYRIQLITPNGPSDVDDQKYLKLGDYLADAHFQNGAHTVIVSAPTTGEDGTFVYGINEANYNPLKDKFIYDGEKPFDSHLLAQLWPITGNVPSSVISESKTFKIGTRGIQFASWYNNELAPPLNQAGLTKYVLDALEKI